MQEKAIKIEVRRREEEWICDVCGAIFNTHAELENHIENDEAPQPKTFHEEARSPFFYCTYCFMTFEKKSLFSAHTTEFSTSHNQQDVIKKLKENDRTGEIPIFWLMPPSTPGFIDILPTGCDIYLDRRYKGECPKKISICPNVTHLISLNPSWDSGFVWGEGMVNKPITAKEGETITLDPKPLLKFHGGIKINLPQTLPYFPKDTFFFEIPIHNDGDLTCYAEGKLYLEDSGHNVLKTVDCKSNHKASSIFEFNRMITAFYISDFELPQDTPAGTYYLRCEIWAPDGEVTDVLERELNIVSPEEVTIPQGKEDVSISYPYWIDGKQKVDVKIRQLANEDYEGEPRYTYHYYAAMHSYSLPNLSLYPSRDFDAVDAPFEDSFEFNKDKISENRRVVRVVIDVKDRKTGKYHAVGEYNRPCAFRDPHPNLNIWKRFRDMYELGETRTSRHQVYNDGDRDCEGGIATIYIDDKKIYEETFTTKFNMTVISDLSIEITVPQDTPLGMHTFKMCIKPEGYPDLLFCSSTQVEVIECLTVDVSFKTPDRQFLRLSEYDWGIDKEIPCIISMKKGWGYFFMLHPERGNEILCMLALRMSKEGSIQRGSMYGCIVDIEDNTVSIYIRGCSHYTVPEECLNALCYWYEYACHQTPRSLPECGSRQKVWSPVPSGVRIGNINSGGRWGTLGCVLRKGGKMMLLSNEHVLGGTIGDVIWQGDTNNEIGTLEDQVADDKVDCAIAKPYDESDIISSILSATDEPTITPSGVGTPYVGEAVMKSGARTGLVVGEILSINTTVDVSGHIVQDTFITDVIGAPGDSGSLVLGRENRAVGLLFGGSNTFAVHCKMTNVLSALGCSLYTGAPPKPKEKTKETTFKTHPTEATLYIDGELIEDTTKPISLTLEEHVIHVIMEDYDDLVSRIEVTDKEITCITGPCYELHPPSITVSDFVVTCRIREKPSLPPIVPEGEKWVTFGASSYAFGDPIKVIYKNIDASERILIGSKGVLHVVGSGEVEKIITSYSPGAYFVNHQARIQERGTGYIYPATASFLMYKDLNVKIRWGYGKSSNSVILPKIPLDTPKGVIVAIFNASKMQCRITSPSGKITEWKIGARRGDGDSSYIGNTPFYRYDAKPETGIWKAEVINGEGNVLASSEQYLYIETRGELNFDKDTYSIGETATISYNNIRPPAWFTLWHARQTTNFIVGAKTCVHKEDLFTPNGEIQYKMEVDEYYKGEIMMLNAVNISAICSVIYKKKKMITIASEPKGARVYINDVFVGET